MVLIRWLYYIALFFLATGAIVEKIFDKEKLNSVIYEINFSFTALLCALRYAQGQDYYGYRFNYYSMLNYSFKQVLLGKSQVHGQILWQIMSWGSARLFCFEIFAGFIALISFLLMHRYMRFHCGKNRNFALLMSFSILIMTYLFSGMRQGLVIAFFLGIILKEYIEKRYLRCVVEILILCLVHPGALFFFVIFVPNTLFTKKRVILLCSASLFVGITCKLLYPIYAVRVPYAIIGILGQSRISLFALGVRILILAVALYIFENLNTPSKEKYRLFVKIVIINSCIYLGLIGFSYIASRCYDVLRFADIALLALVNNREICNFSDAGLKKSRIPGKYIRNVVWVGICSFCVLIALRNFREYAIQGKYESKLFYPYLSVLDKDGAYIFRDDKLYKDYYIYEDGKCIGTLYDEFIKNAPQIYNEAFND